MINAEQFETAVNLLHLQNDNLWNKFREKNLDSDAISPHSDSESDLADDFPIFSSMIDGYNSNVFAKMTNFSPTTLESNRNQI